MRLVIVTGMSGAGKSITLNRLEDAGYFCIDNLPLVFMPMLSEFTNTVTEGKIAIGLDVRSGDSLKSLEKVLTEMEEKQISYETLFLECSNDVLVKRYKETRRMHPLSREGRVDTGIEEERKRLSSLKKKADYIIDTSRMLTRELQAELTQIFVNNKKISNLRITVLSFGFKYGVPSDSDLVFDVRFLPNPYYLPELRQQTGNDIAVQNYVMASEEADEFLWRLEDMIQFLLPNYAKEGKNQLVIAIGCTGGKHRSVTLTNEIYKRLTQDEVYSIQMEHRDIEKDTKRKGKS
jgi:Predicted P-loop-containing kinase